MKTKTEIFNALAPVAKIHDNYRPLLNGVQILPATPDSSGMPIALAKRHRETELSISNHKLKTQFLGYAPVFAGTRVYFGKDSDWAMMNLSEDPLFRFHKSNLHAPMTVIEDVQAVVKAGVKLDAIFIAHEVPKGTLKQGQKVPLELIAPPPSTKVQRRLNLLERMSRHWWKLVGRTSAVAVSTPVVVGAAATVVAVSAAASVGASVGANISEASRQIASHQTPVVEHTPVVPSAGYDPVLLGVQLDPQWTFKGQPIGLWYFITAWNWAELEA